MPLRPTLPVSSLRNSKDFQSRREKQLSPEYRLYREEIQRCIIIKGIPSGILI
jgi:hypothetical protein